MSTCARSLFTSIRAWASAPPATSPYRWMTTRSELRKERCHLHEALEACVERVPAALALDPCAARLAPLRAVGEDRAESVRERIARRVRASAARALDLAGRHRIPRRHEHRRAMR